MSKNWPTNHQNKIFIQYDSLIRIYPNKKKKNDAQHRVIKTPAHRPAEQFKIPNNHQKTKYAIFQGGLIN